MSPPTNSQPRPAPVRSSRKAEMSESTKSELLRRARHAFAEFGFADAPIEALVASAGMSKGALYHHFGSKQGLFLAVVRELSQDIGGVFSRRFEAKPTRAGLLLALTDYLQAVIAPEPRRILIIDAQAVLSAEQLHSLEQDFGVQPLLKALTVLKASGEVRAEDLEASAHLINGALTGIALWAVQSGPKVLKRGVKALEPWLS